MRSSSDFESSKKSRTQPEVMLRKIATAKAAARVDADPPYFMLLKALKDDKTKNVPNGGESVLYWMRLEDMRSLYLSCLILSHPNTSRKSATIVL